MNIKQAAEQSGVSSPNIRFYEIDFCCFFDCCFHKLNLFYEV